MFRRPFWMANDVLDQIVYLLDGWRVDVEILDSDKDSQNRVCDVLKRLVIPKGSHRVENDTQTVLLDEVPSE